MKAVLTAVIAAIEGIAVALAVFAVIALPAVLLWWWGFDLDAAPLALAATVSAVWQLAHFVPMQIEVSAQSALGFGLPPEAFSFIVSLAPLGLTALVVSLAFRSGWRFAARGSEGGFGLIGGTLGYTGSAALIAMLAGSHPQWPLWALITVPTLVYLLPLGTGFVVCLALDGQPWWFSAVRAVQRRIESFAPSAAAVLPERTAETLRLALAGIAGVLGLAGLALACAIIFGYVDIITLSQGLHLDGFGTLLVFLLQLIVLPVALVWAASWLIGPGFSIGEATSVTPFETLLGPLPALPLFGAIPQGWGGAGGIAPALVVVLGVVLGALTAGRTGMRRVSSLTAALVPVCAALLVGFALALLSALASGAIGPGRLAVTGPEPWIVGGVVALELAFGMALGFFARRFDVDRVRSSLLSRELQLEDQLAQAAQPNAEREAASATVQAKPASNTRKPWWVRDGDGDGDGGGDSPSAVKDTTARSPAQSSARVSAQPLAQAPTRPQAPERPETQSSPPLEHEAGDGVEAPEALDPLVRAFSWDAAETNDRTETPQVAERWQDRLRSKFNRD